MKGKQAAILISFVCAAMVVACVNHQNNSHLEQEDPVLDSLTADSIAAAADTLLLDTETMNAPLPEAVDELFDDFIFSFDQSNRLQRNRILFPLPVIEGNGETHYIQRQDWQHNYLFLHQDYYTVLWNSRRQMELAQDTTVNDARVDQIYLHSRQIDSYVFHRDSISRQWMLTEKCVVPFDHTDMAAFLDFYGKFATDSVFQRRHITDPLRFSTTDDDNFEMVQGTINKEQWFEFQPDMPQDVLVHIAYGQTFSHPHQMLLQIRGISNGLQSLFVFHRDGESWRLTELEN